MNTQAPTDSLLVDVEHLHKAFDGKVAVQDISIKIKPGQIYGFIGPNGGGKTTTIRMLCGLLTPDRGRGRCLGYDITQDYDQIKAHIGYMTQSFSLYSELSILENLDFVARMYGLKNRSAVIEKSLQFLGLDNQLRDKLVGTLSGGWKQRLALTCAILHQPKLLLLDEPTIGVDPKARRKFWDEIHHLASQGVSTLVSTHYMDEAARCDELAYIAKGGVRAQGSADEIIRQSGLVAYAVAGPNLESLAQTLRQEAPIEQVNHYGRTVHIIGSDHHAIDSILKQLPSSQYTVASITPELEDVFIHLSDNHNAVQGNE